MEGVPGIHCGQPTWREICISKLILAYSRFGTYFRLRFKIGGLVFGEGNFRIFSAGRSENEGMTFQRT